MANGLFNLKQVVQAVQQGGWTAQKPPSVDYLLVAGGGGAGVLGGGGGAGGVLTGVTPVANGQEILVTVGAGGVGFVQYASTPASNSVFGSVAARAGGTGGSLEAAGAYSDVSGKAGGSGGGGAGFVNVSRAPGGQGTANQGNAGGTSSPAASSAATAGGGGGAGSAAYNAETGYGGDGGAGIASVISGTVTAYGGGGGGGTYAAGITAGGRGGVGGGGNGSIPNVNGVSGTPNTGGGAGGAGSTGTGGTGGSGIVFVSYPDTYAAPSATTGSPTVSTSGSGSMLCNGSSQNIKYAGGTSVSFGTGDLTIEFWANKSADGGSGYDGIFEAQLSGGYAWILELSTSRGFAFIGNGVGSEAVAGVTINDGAWHHWAVCRSGSTWYMFKDGVALTKTTDTIGSGNLAANGDVYIGSQAGSYVFNGLLSNVRVLKGTALYTANFTPSTVPLTPITNTQLLMNTVSGAFLADSSVNSFVPSGTSAPTWSASSPFTGTGYKNRVYKWTSSGSITF